MKNFVSTKGGRTGGWSEFDHTTFVNIRRRYQHGGNSKIRGGGDAGNNSISADLFDRFVEEVASALCCQSTKAIIQHDAWFVHLQQLESAYRLAIEQYKLMKARNIVAIREE